MKNDSELQFLSKDFLDTSNSVFWFLLDACWMMGWPAWAFACVFPTVITGILLLVVEKRRPVQFINLAINCWIIMNCLWMFSDTLQKPELLAASRLAFGLGVVCIGIAVLLSKDLKETFSHFRRFRGLKY